MDIPGLKYYRDYIDEEQHDCLLEQIDSQLWLDDLKRRVQHYGYKYDYKSRTVDSSMFLGQIPDWLEVFSDKLHKAHVFEKKPDQVIINEYEVGQGISRHVDCVPCFGPTIASLSLNSSCVMELIHPQNQTKIPIFLEPRSLIVLQDEARYVWQHRITKRHKDIHQNRKYARKRRVSVTFRTVLLDEAS